MLLEGKADPTVADKDGNTGLHCAKTSELMTALLAAGADPNATNKVKQTLPPIYLSVHNGYHRYTTASRSLIDL